MSSLAMKRVVATALAGATMASAIGAVAASAATPEPARVPPPPSSIAAPAGEAYEDLRAPQQPAVQPTTDEPGGFDVVSAAIGAAAGAGLVIVVLAAGGVARRRPMTRRHGTIGA